MPKPKSKKMGNPNNQGVNGFRGVSAEALRAKRLAKNTPAGQGDENRLVSYDPAAVRAAIEAQMCPFCGAGPFGVLAGHTVRAHGIDRTMLRELGGFTVKDSICSAATSVRMSTHTQDLRTQGKILSGNTRRGGHVLTEEGKRRQAEKNRRRAERIRVEYEADPKLCVNCDEPIAWEKHNDSVTCSNECMREHLAKKAREQWQGGRAYVPARTFRTRTARPCVVCGSPISATAKNSVKACSGKCAGILRRKGPGVCKMCGGLVERRLNTVPAKTCSDECLRALFAARDAKRRHVRDACMVCGGQIPDSRASTAKTCSDQCLRVARSEATRAARRAAGSSWGADGDA